MIEVLIEYEASYQMLTLDMEIRLCSQGATMRDRDTFDVWHVEHMFNCKSYICINFIDIFIYSYQIIYFSLSS